MKDKPGHFLHGLLGLLTLVFVLTIFPSFNWIIPRNGVAPEHEEAIREILSQRIPVEIKARDFFDPSILESVYTNESGSKCPVPENGIKVVQFIRQDPNLQPEQIGILDVMQADVLWWKQATEKVQTIEAQMMAEGRTTMTQEEAESLQDETGRSYPDPILPKAGYPPPSKEGNSATYPDYTIESMTAVSDTQVKVVVQYYEPAVRTEYTFVKIGDSWLIGCVERAYTPEN